MDLRTGAFYLYRCNPPEWKSSCLLREISYWTPSNPTKIILCWPSDQRDPSECRGGLYRWQMRHHELLGGFALPILLDSKGVMMLLIGQPASWSLDHKSRPSYHYRSPETQILLKRRERSSTISLLPPTRISFCFSLRSLFYGSFEIYKQLRL